jgi:hypothetical protein
MTGSSDQSLEELRILLLEYLEGSLPIQIKQTVDEMLVTDEQARKELDGLKIIMNALETDQTLFCPDPSEIADFVITGNDPLGTITNHLKECRSCLEEVQSLRNRQSSDGIPPQILETVRRKLAEVSPDKQYFEVPIAAGIQPPDRYTLIRSSCLKPKTPPPTPASDPTKSPPPMPSPDQGNRSFSLFWKVLLAISSAVGVALLWYYFIRGAP